jgi:hypothetical protein
MCGPHSRSGRYGEERNLLSLLGNEVASAQRSIILMNYASKRCVLYLIAVKQCLALYSDIICIQVIFFGANCKLPSPHCTCYSQSSMTHCSKTERSLATKQRQLQMLSNQLLPTSFLAEEREFHSGNTVYLCSENLCITPNGHITRSI